MSPGLPGYPSPTIEPLQAHVMLGREVRSPLLLLQSSLGLEFDLDRNEILFRNPRLPPFLEEVILRNLRLGQSAVDVMLHRHGTDVSLQVLRNEGHIKVAAVYSDPACGKCIEL